VEIKGLAADQRNDVAYGRTREEDEESVVAASEVEVDLETER